MEVVIDRRSLQRAMLLCIIFGLALADGVLHDDWSAPADSSWLATNSSIEITVNGTEGLDQDDPYKFSEWPEWKKNLDSVATISMAITTLSLMLGMGAATNWGEVLGHASWPPVGILIGMAGQFIILPACGAALAWAFKLTPYEAMGVLMVSSCPGGSLSNFFAYWVDGDLALSIIMTTVSSVLAYVGMPFNLWLYSKIWMDADENSLIVIPYWTILQTLFFIAVPVAIGMIIRRGHQKLASVITNITGILGWLGVIFINIVWFTLYWPVFANATPLIYACAFILPILGFSFAYAFALLACRIKSSMIIFPTLYYITLMAEMFIGILLYLSWKKHNIREEEDYLPVTQETVFCTSQLSPNKPNASAPCISCESKR